MGTYATVFGSPLVNPSTFLTRPPKPHRMRAGRSGSNRRCEFGRIRSESGLVRGDWRFALPVEVEQRTEMSVLLYKSFCERDAVSVLQRAISVLAAANTVFFAANNVLGRAVSVLVGAVSVLGAAVSVLACAVSVLQPANTVSMAANTVFSAAEFGDGAEKQVLGFWAPGPCERKTMGEK